MSDTTKQERKSKGKCQRIIFTVNCNGSNVGNGVGIGNGNQNGGGGGGGGTGGTGGTGDDGGSSVCNLSCEQFFLDQSVEPREVSRIGEELTFVLKATNISPAAVAGPLVIVSSLFGTVLLSDNAVEPGETLTVVAQHIVSADDLATDSITSAAYVARGVATDVPDNFKAGERLSRVVVTSVHAILPNILVTGSVTTDSTSTLTLTLRNIGPLEITDFSTDLGALFPDCEPTLAVPIGSPFTIVEKILSLNTPLAPGASLTVQVLANCAPKFLILRYLFGSAQGAVYSRTLILS